MCAIFGIIGETNPATLRDMSSCQIYRGPDKQNFFIDKKNKFSIGMNRLSVIDKKYGTQPMLSHDKRYIVVFNGTIYNFNELKKFLYKKKINFNTNSDTEVLINAYSYWGDKCFNYFDGMWAVGIYDFKIKKFILSRDYVGQKPLFYYNHNEKLIFSSQINGIFKYSNKFKISKKNYEDYLRFSYFHSPNTLYENIYQVCPGEIVEFTKKKITKKNFWKIENKSDYNFFFKRKKKKDIKKTFVNVINNFLIADKKVALSLSVGNDSNLLKNIMLKHKKKINSFTIGFKDKTYDEASLVKSSINNSNTKKIILKKDLVKSFKRIKKNIYFPFGDSSSVPTLELFNLVKKKTNVIIGGDGGDEIFFGYLAFKVFYLLTIIRKVVPKFFLGLLKFPFKKIRISTGYLNFRKKIKIFFKYINKDLSLINSYWFTNFDEYDVKEYFQRDRNNYSSKNILKVKDLYKKFSDKNRFAQIYYIKYFLPMILTKVDFTSMLNSVESRSPYLCKDLLNFSLDISTKKNFSLFKNRKLMKDIFNEFFNDIEKFKKHGFAFNKHLILNDEKLIKKNIDNSLILNPEYFHKKHQEYLKGNYDSEQYLWNEIILNFSRQNLEHA
jgi:asparagine synthase (glutamine-hydrolysing)